MKHTLETRRKIAKAWTPEKRKAIGTKIHHFKSTVKFMRQNPALVKDRFFLLKQK